MQDIQKLVVKKSIWNDDRGKPCKKCYSCGYDGKLYKKVMDIDIFRKDAGFDAQIEFVDENYTIILYVDKIEGEWLVVRKDMFPHLTNSFDMRKKEFPSEDEKNIFIETYIATKGYMVEQGKVWLTTQDKQVLEKVINKVLKPR